MLLKPEESLLFRPTNGGGLGFTSVKQKAKAFLIRNFLELAVNPHYINSQFLSRIYRHHILGEDITSPPLPPYYSAAFLTTIREAISEGNDIVSMSTRKWYKYLLDKEVLTAIGDDGRREKVLCRIERSTPDVDWISTWGKIRLPFLSSRVVSFLWKLCHDILTTEERVNSTLGTITNWCRFGCDHHPVANQIHCFFNCTMTYNIGQWLLQTVRSFGPASELDVLRMNVPNNHALIWIIAEGC